MKTKSQAYLKLEAQRDALHVGEIRVDAPDLSSVLYLYMLNDEYYYTAFLGRKTHPQYYRKFKTNEQRISTAIEFMKEHMVRAANNGAKPRALEVGDVLRASWGYEQTNIDYFLVQALKGKTQVIVTEIGSDIIQTGDMQGNCIPDPETLKGESMLRKADGDCVKINDCVRARKMIPKIVMGARIYKSSSYSSYH